METQVEYQKNQTVKPKACNENFQYGSEKLAVVDKQTYLGIEMTSSGRYTYARDIKFLRQ